MGSELCFVVKADGEGVEELVVVEEVEEVLDDGSEGVAEPSFFDTLYRIYCNILESEKGLGRRAGRFVFQSSVALSTDTKRSSSKRLGLLVGTCGLGFPSTAHSRWDCEPNLSLYTKRQRDIQR